MPIDNPTALVEEFKKSGEFDRIRRDLLHQFQNDVSDKEFSKRYPIVERAVADVRMFSDPSFLASIQTSIQRILRGENGGSPGIKDGDVAKPTNNNGDHTEKAAAQHAQHAAASKSSQDMVTAISADFNSPPLLTPALLTLPDSQLTIVVGGNEVSTATNAGFARPMRHAGESDAGIMVPATPFNNNVPNESTDVDMEDV
ncbi:hypothetical protein B0H34DRAFT_671019 [Crassisporium funariophilum]|nr:hypothetical protein B0H34DRAFT_671019 [Crassisporium funariophilum]